MAFTNAEVKKIMKHVTKCLLSFGKSLDKTLLQWDALGSYFLSEFKMLIVLAILWNMLAIKIVNINLWFDGKMADHIGNSTLGFDGKIAD